MSESWREFAKCAEVGGDVFFPADSGETEAAKRICGGCPVRDECLEWAMDNSMKYGVWGGLSAYERIKLRWARRDAA